MVDRVLFVPGWAMSPNTSEAVPVTRANLNRLREHFDVTVFRWPTIRGGPELPPTVEGAVQALGESLTAADHLVVMGSNVIFALLALHAHPTSVYSIVCDGVVLPVSTLDAAGLGTMARAVEASVRIDSQPYQSTASRLEGAADDEARQLMERMYADADWRASDELWHSYSGLNLLDDPPTVGVPTLMIQRGFVYPESPDTQALFRRFAPNTEFVGPLVSQLHKPEGGLAFAEQAIAFIRKHRPRTVLTTVLFADIVDSTVHAATLGDRQWSQLLSQFHDLVAQALQHSGGTLVDTAGDGFLAVFDDPAAAVECASRVAADARELDLETRAGIQSGQTEVSSERYSGVAVHTAARVAAKAAPGEVLVSETVRQLLARSGLSFEERGSYELKGLPEPVRLYAAT